MNRLLVCCLVVYGVGFFGSGEVPAGGTTKVTIKGTAFDLGSPPKPRKNRKVPITVTGIGLDAAGQPKIIPLPKSASELEKDGTYKVVIDNSEVRAVSLFFQGSNDRLQDVRLDRLLNKDQTIDVSLPNADPNANNIPPPNAEPLPPGAIIPCYVIPYQAPCTRRRLFHR